MDGALCGAVEGLVLKGTQPFRCTGTVVRIAAQADELWHIEGLSTRVRIRYHPITKERFTNPQDVPPVSGRPRLHGHNTTVRHHEPHLT